MHYFKQKVRYLVKLRNMTMESFANAMGMKRQAVYELLDRPTIKPEIVAKICHILKVDKKYFDVKDEYPPVDEFKPNIASEGTTEYKAQGNVTFVPLKAYGGFLHGYSNKVFMDTLEHYNVPGLTGKHYAFEIDGMSMYNKSEELSAKPGDIAYGSEIDNLTELLKNKAYILVTIDGICYKIFDKLTDKSAFFRSLNPDYEGIELPLKSIKKAYFVSRILKKI